MSTHFTKPENALRKAQDLVNLGKSSDALQNLAAIITSKRHRNFTPVHELVMLRYVELAVELRQNIKDVLNNYRIVCQQAVNFSSLEKVVKRHVSLAEARVKAAQDAVAGEGVDVKIEIEDLDETPESMLMESVSGEGAQDRKDRAVLLPWVKYLWESYRSVLDIVRNNSKLEPLYHSVARQAFEFCRSFKRTQEFRRLCDLLRNHLQGITKYQTQAMAVDLTAPETQKLYLETRFLQLNVASELELWQEAYRTIEDIHESMRPGLSMAAKPALMRNYYGQLSRIFYASENPLFHAYSLFSYYRLSIDEDKSMSGEAKQQLANSVVLSALVIPPTERYGERADSVAEENENNLRLASLLGFKREAPTRARLMEEMAPIVAVASDDVRGLFQLLESKFAPLVLKKQALPILARLESSNELGKYVAQVKVLMVLRVLQQLARVYKTMRLAQFYSLVPEMGPHVIERLIMAAVKADQLFVKIDHRDQVLLFSEESMESSRMRDQIFLLANRLQKVVDVIAPVDPEDKQRERRHVFGAVKQGMESEHSEIAQRNREIERRKQEAERAREERERREAEDKAREEAKRKAEEKQRMMAESAKREEERVKREAEARELRQKQQLAESLAKRFPGDESKRTLGGKAVRTLRELTTNLDKVDKAQLLKAQQQLLEQEKKNVERKRKERSQMSDYLVRAMRLEEQPLLIAAYEEKQKVEQVQMEEEFKKYLVQHKEAHRKSLEERDRLLRLRPHLTEFTQRVMERRTQEYEEQMAVIREEQQREAEAREREEARKRKEMEEKRRQEQLAQEREERLKKEAEEEKARKIAERLAERKRLDEAERQRLALEEELERKDQARRQAMLQARETPARAAPAATTGSSWRDRQAERERAAPAAAAGGPSRGGFGETWRDREQPSSNAWSRGGARGGDREEGSWSRGGARGGDREEGSWSRGGARGGAERGDREEGSWSRGGARGGDREDGSWSRGGPRGGAERGDREEGSWSRGGARGGDREEGSWSRGGPRRGDQSAPASANASRVRDAEKQESAPADDGWQRVGGGSRRR